MKKSILLIEDSPENQRVVSEALGKLYSVSTLSDADQAFATVDKWARKYQLVIIEEAIQGNSGLKLLHEARSARRDLPVVVVTRDGNWSSYGRALEQGASDYLPQPINQRILVTAVEEALAQAT